MNGAAIVDASVALKWYVLEPDSWAALRFLQEQEADLKAPTLLLTELANGLWKKWRQAAISSEDADRAVAEVSGFFLHFVPTEALLPHAMQLSRALDHPVYDCCYLALAMREGSPLVSADDRLIRKVSGTSHEGRVLPLSNWSDR